MDVLLYAPNIVGYVRIVFLAIAVMASHQNVFLAFYGISYLLDALDGYLARSLNQSSTFGYILDMATDRASSTALIIRIASKTQSPRLRTFLTLTSILDIFSHFICVCQSSIFKQSHKEHAGKGFISSILKAYYSRTVLFTVCLFTEVFLMSLLVRVSDSKAKTTPFMAVSLPFFVFKQLTNVAQTVRASDMLSTIK